jgi:hypothetical protein
MTSRLIPYARHNASFSQQNIAYGAMFCCQKGRDGVAR